MRYIDYLAHWKHCAPVDGRVQCSQFRDSRIANMAVSAAKTAI